MLFYFGYNHARHAQTKFYAFHLPHLWETTLTNMVWNCSGRDYCLNFLPMRIYSSVADNLSIITKYTLYGYI